jgi:hypothetical protein
MPPFPTLTVWPQNEAAPGWTVDIPGFAADQRYSNLRAAPQMDYNTALERI